MASPRRSAASRSAIATDRPSPKSTRPCSSNQSMPDLTCISRLLAVRKTRPFGLDVPALLDERAHGRGKLLDGDRQRPCLRVEVPRTMEAERLELLNRVALGRGVPPDDAAPFGVVAALLRTGRNRRCRRNRTRSRHRAPRECRSLAAGPPGPSVCAAAARRRRLRSEAAPAAATDRRASAPSPRSMPAWPVPGGRFVPIGAARAATKARRDDRAGRRCRARQRTPARAAAKCPMRRV